ncbi:MAG: type II CAAX prenyl endopeptidase Rce1 family protein [Tuberibacillus sp.]
MALGHGFSPLYVLFLVVSGCTLLYVYVKSGSLITSTFVHAAVNLSTGQIMDGKSSISLLSYQSDLSIIHLGVVMVFTSLLIIALTKIFYKKTAIQIGGRTKEIEIKNIKTV